MTWKERGRRSVEMLAQGGSATGAAFVWCSARSQRAIVAAFVFVMALVVEQYHGLSLVRFLCIYFAGVVGHSIEMRANHTPTITDGFIISMVIAAAFGEKVFLRKFAAPLPDVPPLPARPVNVGVNVG